MNREQLKKLERDLWAAADKLRANSDLKASEYSTPVLGLIFLKFADNKYRQHEAAIVQEYEKLKGSRREKSLEENYYEELAAFAEGLRDEAERHIREGLSEDELELFDLLKKDAMTQEETQRVKLSAKRLLKRLVDEHPKLLVQDWFKDRQSMQQVRSEIERVLDDALPESYDRTTFKQKCDNVFDLAVDYANHHRRWAA